MDALIGIFLQVLNMSFTAGLVILVVLIARLALRRAPGAVRWALWAVVLFRLLCPVSLESALALLPTRAQPVTAQMQYAAQPRVETGISVVDDAVSSVLPAATPQNSVNPIQIWMAVGAAVWALGAVGLASGGAVSLLRLKHRLRGAHREEEGVYIVPGLETAFVLGVIRPRIYLPEGLQPQEREYILRHERTHIRRGDPVFRLLGYAALCLHWFNPLVWLAFRLSGRDMEMACDEAVIRQLGAQVKRDYSATLLHLATGRSRLLGGPLAFGESDTKGRIRNVLRYRKPALWLTVLVVALAAVLGIGLALNRPEPQDMVRVGGVTYTEPGTSEPGKPEPGKLNSSAVAAALGLADAQVFWVNEEPEGCIVGFTAGDDLGVCAAVWEQGEWVLTQRALVPGMAAGEPAATAVRLTLGQTDYDVVLNTSTDAVRVTRTTSSGAKSEMRRSGEQGPTLFAWAARPDDAQVRFDFYDEAGNLLPMTVQMDNRGSAGVDARILSVEFATRTLTVERLDRENEGKIQSVRCDGAQVTWYDGQELWNLPFALLREGQNVVLFTARKILPGGLEAETVQLSDDPPDRQVVSVEVLERGSVVWSAYAPNEALRACAEEAMLHARQVSAAFEGGKIDELDSCIHIIEYVKGWGEMHGYVYLLDGKPVLQKGDQDLYTAILPEDWEALCAAVGGGD